MLCTYPGRGSPIQSSSVPPRLTSWWTASKCTSICLWIWVLLAHCKNRCSCSWRKASGGDRKTLCAAPAHPNWLPGILRHALQQGGLLLHQRRDAGDQTPNQTHGDLRHRALARPLLCKGEFAAASEFVFWQSSSPMAAVVPYICYWFVLLCPAPQSTKVLLPTLPLLGI